jgi:hypothetical protein
MAITRGQMQRQLRRGGGIMNITPRERFGIGSSLKKFVRKVIPNEVSKVATVAAPFVAPFNPQLAAAMAGIGSFDQTGSIGDSLKRAGITYAGGQLARAAGGAGFQDPSMSLQGFTNLTSPTSGATIFGGFGGPKVAPIDVISGSDYGQFKEPVFGADDLLGGEMQTVAKPASKELAKSVATETFTESAPKSVMKAIQEKNYGEAAKLAAEKGFNAVFKKPIRNDAGKIVGYDLDKNTLFAAGAFGLTYLDAKKVADAEGVDIGTEEEYDEATKAAKKEEYASYLTNFFGGKKDGGRIGFGSGSIVVSEDELAEMGGLQGLQLKLLAEKFMEQGMSESSAYEKAANQLYKAQGGRIGFRFGDKVEDKEGIMSMSDEDKESILPMTEEEDMKMAGGITFNKRERAYLYKRLGSSYTSGKDKSMPNLFYILNDPGSYPSDAAILKRIAIMGLGGKKEGGRIGFESGANKEYKFMELIEDDTDEKEKLINALLDNAREKFPEASEEDIFNFVMSKAAPMSGLMVDGEFVRSKDIETPSIKLSRDMGGPRYDFLMGGEVPVRKNKAGIEELDYRQSGGFVPVGVKEKADDVPAMLSKNEFVLTADAVRGIGGGDVEKGAEKLYGVMKQAEKVGRA